MASERRKSPEESLADRLRLRNGLFASHPGSEDCSVCYAAEALRESGQDVIAKGFLLRVFDRGITQSEINTIITYHWSTNFSLTFPSNWRESTFEGTLFIRKVEIVLGLNGQWPALRFEEYKRGDVRQGGPHDVVRALTDLELTKAFRLNAKESWVLLPCLGRVGDARPVGSLLDPELVKGWIQRCKANHSFCSKKRKGSFPVDLILIDTVDNRTVEIPQGDEPPYLALSYTWGGLSQPELTKANRERRSVKGGLTGLHIPQTILDAIHLAKLIGYRYLWVDALCIVQDDTSIRHHQIAQMYDIYQSADVTIVAAIGSDCSRPIPGVGLDRKPGRYRVNDVPGTALRKLPASIKDSIQNSNWKTRGWTFQEELCSQRLLVLLPECAVFTCPSALCREDLSFEACSSWQGSQGSEHAEDFREGLNLLSVTTRSLENAGQERQTALFQDLVNQYMHRSFSRHDDIENAFAGVSRMLEPAIGSSYHGIPDKYFVDIIHGCWFWDTGFVRREGDFPSWSWVGWIYEAEQAYVGIKPGAGQKPLLSFCRWDGDIQQLGHSSMSLVTPLDKYPSIFEHFVQDKERARANFLALHLSATSTHDNNLISFTTSCAFLNIRPLYHTRHTSMMVEEYLVIHPSTRKRLTSIRLQNDFVQQRGKLHQFVIIASDEASSSFRLMLVSPTRTCPRVVERVNVTVANRLVPADDWISLGPEKSTIIMA